jgi:hypothetical protein
MTFINSTKLVSSSLIGTLGLGVVFLGLPQSSVTAFESCGGACGTRHHKMANVSFGFNNGLDIQYTTPVPFALTGFGYGITSDPIVLPPGSPNPQLPSATADWVDFRFYANIPNIGIVKGSLNPDRPSYVSLNALQNDGLFPAAFLNNMFIKLEPLSYPGLVYENTEPIQLAAPSVTSAPPDSSIITSQIGEDIFYVVGTPAQGTPTTIKWTDGLQSFLEDNNNLDLELLSQENDSLMSFKVKNLLDIPVTVAYFLYFNGDAVLAKSVQEYDGTLNLDSHGTQGFSFDISRIPGVTPQNAIVSAMILDPYGTTGADQWKGNAVCVPEPLTILGSLAALGFGAACEKKRGKKSKKDQQD